MQKKKIYIRPTSQEKLANALVKSMPLVTRPTKYRPRPKDNERNLFYLPNGEIVSN